MNEPRSRGAADSEPFERVPAGPVEQLLVPVRSGPLGHTARMFRTPLGDRTAVAFSTEAQLTAALGPAQAWVLLAESALRALAEPLGVTRLTVDPQFVAAAPRPLSSGPDCREARPRPAAAPRPPADATPSPAPAR
ncbi:SAV_915 family protein [Kitasatospora mediocidica]|uniref:SAV_915 family protein n=1 Tax=Kitasatospora mediocidica TaxID=58352 RepID=UPI0007C73191|nr:SAV_915 family protein [Kitasatospora mediocidica]